MYAEHIGASIEKVPQPWIDLVESDKSESEVFEWRTYNHGTAPVYVDHTQFGNREFIATFTHPTRHGDIQVEINELENTDEYIHLGIGVDDGGLSAYRPASTSVILPKPSP